MVGSERAYTLAEVAQHTTELDCWAILGKEGNKRVYDLTAFLEEHPGGPELLLDLAGQDIQEEFEDIGHSKEAHEMLQDLCIGVLKPGNDTGPNIRRPSLILSRQPSRRGFFRSLSLRFILVIGTSIFVALLAMAWTL